MWWQKAFSSLALKRSFDLIASAGALLLTLPLFAVIAIGIKLDSPGPVFFLQQRVGFGGRLFHIIKFRSMKSDSESLGMRITECGDPRITRFGRLLRKWKLDELPQLINVVLGDMSVVGPRPEVPEFVEMLSSKERQLLFSIRPGITDYATIRFRNEEQILSNESDPKSYYSKNILPEKSMMHRKYILERNFFIDMKIIFYTICRIFTARRYQEND